LTLVEQLSGSSSFPMCSKSSDLWEAAIAHEQGPKTMRVLLLLAKTPPRPARCLGAINAA
jgi:hypothetical protein